MTEIVGIAIALVANIIVIVRYATRIEAKLDILYRGLVDERGKIDVYNRAAIRGMLERRDGEIKTNAERIAQNDELLAEHSARIRVLERRDK